MLKAMLPDEQLADANGAYQSIREGLRSSRRSQAPGSSQPSVARPSRSSTPEHSSCRPRRSSRCASPSRNRRRRAPLPSRSLCRHHAHRAFAVLRELTIGIGAGSLVAGFSETIIFAVTSNGLHRSPRSSASSAAFQGSRRDPGRRHSSAADPPRGDLRLAGIGILLFGLGDSFWLVPRTRLVLAAPQSQVWGSPGPSLRSRRRTRYGARAHARAGRGRRQYAVQRAADDLASPSARRSSRSSTTGWRSSRWPSCFSSPRATC